MKKKIVLVGASTGGPTLIKKILTSMNFLSYSIVIAQHMKEEVLPQFIKELKQSSSINVLSAPQFLDLDKSAVYICSTSSVLSHEGHQYQLKKDTQNQKFTPDIDKLFSSFVEYASLFDLYVIIMTGMGSDGIAGAKALKDVGATIIAQDKVSSPLYGMPRVAFEEGIVDEVKSFDEIQEFLKNLR